MKRRKMKMKRRKTKKNKNKKWRENRQKQERKKEKVQEQEVVKKYKKPSTTFLHHTFQPLANSLRRHWFVTLLITQQ